jgi:hypothetical protein
MFRFWKRQTAKEALHLEQAERALDRAEELITHRQQVAALAYEIWQSRGSPPGSSEEDWYQAEKQLQETR